MFEFVCVIYFSTSLNDYMYIGNFESCAHANSHVAKYYTEEEIEWVKCLHEDYITLPKGFIKKEVRYER